MHDSSISVELQLTHPVFSSAHVAPQSQEISTRIEPNLYFRCGKSEMYPKCILQDGLSTQDAFRHAFLLLSDLLLVNDLCASGSPAPQKESLWFLSPILHTYFPTWHLCVCELEVLLWRTQQGGKASLRCDADQWLTSDMSLGAPVWPSCFSLPLYCNSL